MNQQRILLTILAERTSAKGNPYLAGWLGKARLVAFRGEPDQHGNPTWQVYAAEPEPRRDEGQARTSSSES